MFGHGIAQKSTNEPLTEKEVRSLFDRHDGNGTGTLERAEVLALFDDIRRIYGLEQPLPVSSSQVLFKAIDHEGQGTLNWNDVRQLAGSKSGMLKKTLQRARAKKQHLHHEKKKEETWGDWVGGLTDIAKPNAATVANVEVSKVRGKEVKVIFHPLRAEGIPHEGVFAFRPLWELRAVRGDPKLGRGDQREAGSLEEPFIAQVTGEPATGTTDDPTWDTSITLTVEHQKGLYVHGFLCESGLLGLTPLADFSIALDYVLELQEKPKVKRYDMDPIDTARVSVETKLIAQFGGDNTRFDVTCHVVRAQMLPEGWMIVEISLRGDGSGNALISGRTQGGYGPNPVFNEAIELGWQDEGNMTLHCKVFSSTLGMEEPVAELAKQINQSDLEKHGVANKYALKPIGEASAGAEIVLAFGPKRPQVSLSLKPSAASGVVAHQEAWSFSPFVQAKVLAADPKDGLKSNPEICCGQTESLQNCNGDPHWLEPILLPDLTYEKGLFLQVSICSDRFGREADVIAEMVMTLDEAIEHSKKAIERKYPLKALIDTRREEKPVLYAAFTEQGGSLVAGATDNRKYIPEVGLRIDEEEEIGGTGGAGNARSEAGSQGDFSPGRGGVGNTEDRDQSPSQGYRGGVFRSPVTSEELREAHPEVEEELAPLQELAAKRGGAIRGMVPLSFLSSNQNPHFIWMNVR